MKSQKGIRVIFDTNIWISYLIGKELRNLTELISSKRIEIVISEQLLTEIIEVTARSKFRKYFNTDKVDELISLINLLGAKFKIDSIPEICDDPKDNFLFGLIRESNAHFLVTGDKHLLSLNPFEGTQILEPNEFEKRMQR